MVWPLIIAGFPRPKLGSFDAIGLDGQVCTDRDSRYGIYGYGGLHQSTSPIDWNKVNWGGLQSRCFFRNAGRYQVGRDNINRAIPLPGQFTSRGDRSRERSSGYKSRSAVIIRVWHDMPWTENFKHYIRSVSMELSLHSGAEYEVLILVHVRAGVSLYFPNGKIDDVAINRLAHTHIPPEFHDMVMFFSERTLDEWYPEVGEHMYVLPWRIVQRPR